MSYSFVWLYLLKCVFTCSIFVDSNTKRFLNVLGVFGKHFVFTKTKKFQKQCCPVLVTQSQVIQVACFSCKLACWFWWLVREWKVQSRGVHRDFHSSTRDSLTGRPSNREKHLENFHNFDYWEFWQLVGNLFQSWKMHVLRFKDSFFKFFQFFPRLFVTVHYLPHFFLNWNWPKHFSNFISTTFLLQSSRKRYGFSLSHFIFHVLSLLFLFLWVYCCHYVFEKCHARSRVCFILVIVHFLRVSVFDFITGVYMKSGVCALFHDSSCFIHIIFMVFYHIICHLNPCNAQCPLDSELLMFISIFDCLLDRKSVV